MTTWDAEGEVVVVDGTVAGFVGVEVEVEELWRLLLPPAPAGPLVSDLLKVEPKLTVEEPLLSGAGVEVGLGTEVEVERGCDGGNEEGTLTLSGVDDGSDGAADEDGGGGGGAVVDVVPATGPVLVLAGA